MPSPREVLERARAGMRPRPQSTADGWARLQARLEDPDDVPELPRVPASEPPRTRVFVLAAAIAIAAAVALWLAMRGEAYVPAETAPQQQAPDRVQERETSESVRMPAPAAPMARDEPSGEVPAPFAEDRADVEPPRERPSRPSRAKEVPADTLATELALLQRAKQALARGDAEAALSLVREHARAHPNGALAEERFATHVRALCALDRTDEAARVAGRFADAHPRSGVARALRADPCGKKE